MKACGNYKPTIRRHRMAGLTMPEKRPTTAFKKSIAKHCLNPRRQAGSNHDMEPGHVAE
jgi:hypothetical protein